MSLALQANMHALASELERVKTELNDRTAMMGMEMERWRQQADATSTQVLLHHVMVIFRFAGACAIVWLCEACPPVHRHGGHLGEAPAG